MKTIRNNDGFTLLEIIISTAVLCFISVFILEMFVAAASLNTRAKNTDIATMKAITEIESIKKCPLLADYLSDKRDRAVTGSGGIIEVDYYFDKDWRIVDSGENARFCIETRITPEETPQLPADSNGVRLGKLYTVCSDVYDLSYGNNGLRLSSIETEKYFSERY